MLSIKDRLELGSYPLTKFVQVAGADIDNVIYHPGNEGQIKNILSYSINGKLLKVEAMGYADASGTVSVLAGVDSDKFLGLWGKSSHPIAPSKEDEGKFY